MNWQAEVLPANCPRYDYIIVGAGSAGCVLANRLSASGTKRVLLLEAGPSDTNPWIHIPLGYGKLFKDPSVNWLYRTEPQAHLNGRVIGQPRGKVLGGSSSINGLIYIRGQREDFDDWRQLGNPGWGWEDVFPYFLRAERQARGASAYHGVDGLLRVSDQREPHELCEAFIEAATQTGFSANTDFNGATQEGAGYFQTTSHLGRRVSAAVAYLRPARRRSNLEVITQAHVTRVVIESARATGLVWRQGGEWRCARADAELILSGGAINTPQLLQLSGVGPGPVLQDNGIRVIKDLPGVGENLHDHLQVRIVYKCRKRITVNDDLHNPLRKLGVGLRYALLRKGPLTVSAGYAGGFFRTDPSVSRPDIQMHFITFSTTKMGDKLHPFSGFTVSSCQLRPESRGSVRIKSADPFAAPAIDPNYLATPFDCRTNVAGVRLIRQIMGGAAMQPYVAQELEPGQAIVSDADLLSYCRNTASTLYHPTCTARMGADPGAVVDNRLRVRGIRNLRVVDGSVMPAVVSGNTHASIVMIGEKAADLILQDAAHPAPLNLREIQHVS
jgi:choline dehydrogenase